MFAITLVCTLRYSFSYFPSHFLFLVGFFSCCFFSVCPLVIIVGCTISFSLLFFLLLLSSHSFRFFTLIQVGDFQSNLSDSKCFHFTQNLLRFLLILAKYRWLDFLKSPLDIQGFRLWLVSPSCFIFFLSFPVLFQASVFNCLSILFSPLLERWNPQTQLITLEENLKNT